jgi:hypothetical protein
MAKDQGWRLRLDYLGRGGARTILRMRTWLCLAVLTCGAVLAVSCGSSKRHLASTRTTTTKFPEDHFLPGGIRTLAEGLVPDGPAFAISAERYRFEGKIYVDLATQMEPHARLTGGEGSFSPEPSSNPLTWSAEQGCSRHPPVSWSVLYGLLRDPADHVLVYTGRLGHPTRTAAIPASLHLRGVVDYVALVEPPTRVVVRDSAGSVIQDESFGSFGKVECNPEATSSLIVMQPRHSKKS